ncbi:MAG: TonB-dependent receptor [Sphingomonas sp.]|uniref:TonB-dependent receptor plug domain-containing protein n=1 Tax=Sphingomonas sp. TaxID=28214 RepID=UPI001B1F1231|nr:TonB-dependent receptor [Sphingomonas sp.]MBO9623443.1 TonB-dependent receptor [Sphingomonas sp.]
MAYSVVRFPRPAGRARLAFASSLLAMTIAAPAYAQDAPEAQATEVQDAPDTEIVVTGSRIARPELSLPNPVQVVTSENIEQSGKVNLTDFLVNNPALLGSQSSIFSAGSNLANAQSTGINLLNLRNLGTQRTLVLVDGRRHVAGVPGIAAVDINTIPTDLVEKIDVLTGGASAIYGADGVSGVVNFILKKDFDGLRVRGQTSISQRGDAGERYLAVTGGKNFADGRGNVTLAYEYNQTDRFSQSDRLNYGKTGPSYAFVRNPADFPDDPNVPDRLLFTNLRWADSSPGGAIDLDGDGVPDRTGEGGIYDLGTYLPGSAYTIGGSSTPRESYYGDFTPYSERHIANVMAHYDFSPAFQLYAEGKYVRSKAYTFAQPTYDFYTELAPDNAYLSQRFGADAANGALFSRDNFDFGIRRYEMERELFRTVVGAKGDIASNLSYDVSYVFGQSTQESTNRNDRITDRYYAALDAVFDASGNITCRINLPGQTSVQGNNYGGQPVFNGAPVTFAPGQCVPLNILGQGSPSQAALDFVTVDHSDWARIKQHVVTAALSGNTGAFFNLPGGPVGFAIGAEYRKESSDYIPSDYSLAGQLMDNAPARRDKGSFDVKEAFAEINLPILADTAFAKNLSIGGAVRLSDYSTVGQTTTWNVNGSYSPVRDITFRGTYSEAVRAPNITELFAGGSGTYEFITDPCGPERIAEGTQYRAANCAAVLSGLGVDQATFDPANDFTSPANSSLLGFQGGNPTLREETAKTWTAGVVLRPSFVPGFSLSADWYDIRLKQAIQYSTAQDVVDLCVDQPDLDNIYCNVIDRSPTTGFVSFFTIIPENVASFETAGLDVELNYRFEPFDNAGTFNIKLVGNYLNKLQFVPTAGADPENELDSWEYPAPKYSANFDLTWVKGPLTMNYGINWQTKTRRVTREQEAANADYVPAGYFWYKEKWEHEFYVSYDVNDQFNLYAGVNNLFDSKPDVGAVAYPISAVGRSFFLGIKTKLF